MKNPEVRTCSRWEALFYEVPQQNFAPLLIMLWLNGCMSVNTQIVGQTYQPLEPQEVHVFTLKEFIEIILEKRNVSNWPTSKLKIFPEEKFLDFASHEASKIGANYIAVVAFYNHYLGGNHIEVNAYKCSGIENEILIRINSSEHESRTLCFFYGF